MIKIIYHLIVLYLSMNFVYYIFREKKLWNQVSVAVVLVMFLLRLLLIK